MAVAVAEAAVTVTVVVERFPVLRCGVVKLLHDMQCRCLLVIQARANRDTVDP